MRTKRSRPKIPQEKQRYRVSSRAEARQSLNFFRAMILTDSSNLSKTDSEKSDNDLTESDNRLRRDLDG